ncbi:hypothetical protein J2I47_02550 [Fibrella sp. HMF5335]|uniref:Uncharacterized protein n=1 Tax=Fibrella rubiginis TaxID=2817060 RepID=A0A939GAQ3_9BACT|nr:hypothetical protein [Fibrella rubiginis]MBO0935419.1 hypothetical protein [Fibrella rubiginis]
MKTLDYFVALAYVVVNAFSLLQVVGSFRWPTITRFVFFLIFLIAAIVNTRTVLNTPWVYESYADYAIPIYSRFILGPFGTIITPMVLCIAVGQVCIALSMFMKGPWFQVGCLGGMAFCLAIAPLGLGAAFPSTVLMAYAFYRLYKHEDRQTVADVLDRNQVLLPLD